MSRAFLQPVRRLCQGRISRVNEILVLVVFLNASGTPGGPLGSRLALGLCLGPSLHAVDLAFRKDLQFASILQLQPMSRLGGFCGAGLGEHVGARNPRGVRDGNTVLEGEICAPFVELFLGELLIPIVVGTKLG